MWQSLYPMVMMLFVPLLPFTGHGVTLEWKALAVQKPLYVAVKRVATQKVDVADLSYTDKSEQTIAVRKFRRDRNPDFGEESA